MTHEIHYDVFVKEDGRWEINSSHQASEEDKAVEIAKSLDAQRNIESVKVIREVFDPEEGTTKTSTIYTPGRLWR